MIGDDLRRARAAAQFLGADRASSAEAVVERLVGIPAQDLRSAKLALRARTDGLHAGGLDAALGDTFVLGWLMRGTLHLVRREDYPWLLDLFAARHVANNTRRLRQEGVSEATAQRHLGRLATFLDGGPKTRAEISEHLALDGQALIHPLALSTFRGLSLHLGASFARSEGTVPSVRREEAIGELARRYTAGYVASEPQDFAAWSGLSLGMARGVLPPQRTEETGPPVRPVMLGGWDPWLMGFKDRGFALPKELRKQVLPGGGMLRAVCTVDGVVTGTWTAPGGEPQLNPPDERFAGEVEDVRRFLAPSR